MPRKNSTYKQFRKLKELLTKHYDKYGFDEKEDALYILSCFDTSVSQYHLGLLESRVQTNLLKQQLETPELLRMNQLRADLTRNIQTITTLCSICDMEPIFTGNIFSNDDLDRFVIDFWEEETAWLNKHVKISGDNFTTE